MNRIGAALRESEDRFRTMANSMAQLAWIARPVQGVCQRASTTDQATTYDMLSSLRGRAGPRVRWPPGSR